MTIELDNATKLSYNQRKSKRFSWPRKLPKVFFGDKFEQRITSEIKNFWGFNSNEIEVFPRKVKSKSIALSGGTK